MRHAFTQEADKVTLDENGTPVAVTSQEPDSIRGGYHIGFAPLDRNHDGFISHVEAPANPTLAREFDALDALHTGRRSKA